MAYVLPVLYFYLESAEKPCWDGAKTKYNYSIMTVSSAFFQFSIGLSEIANLDPNTDCKLQIVAAHDDRSKLMLQEIRAFVHVSIRDFRDLFSCKP